MQEQELCCRLAAAGIENAAFEARLLCEKWPGGVPHDVVLRRESGYPVQYILGEWDFYRETYEVSEDCLIPRPDTEHLVEQAIKRLPEGATFLDLCTGSGCVAISTLCARPDTTAVAVDLFDPTLALAQRNAKRNGVADRLTFLKADVLQAPPKDLGKFGAILSNPPYIQNAVVPTLQREVHFEPQAALCGGADGLDFYRSILQNWRHLLVPDGFFLFEIGYDQATALSELGAALGLSAEVFRDYGGNDRVVYLR
ncbi:MAG: peptide chain release factor N(5)-glutamine methyltransferase [Clostridia bacterium]|nr:peptide chain release factor N(5)-glutamine methyltransferase [Clostridia bacterium]